MCILQEPIQFRPVIRRSLSISVMIARVQLRYYPFRRVMPMILTNPGLKILRSPTWTFNISSIAASLKPGRYPDVRHQPASRSLRTAHEQPGRCPNHRARNRCLAQPAQTQPAPAAAGAEHVLWSGLQHLRMAGILRSAGGLAGSGPDALRRSRPESRLLTTCFALSASKRAKLSRMPD